MHQENWNHARHTESQRATLANLILVIVSVIHAFLAQIGLGQQSLPMSILLIVLGLFGAVASAKLYERLTLHMHRASKIYRHLDELCPDAQLTLIKDEVYEERKNLYKSLSRIRVNYVWTTLYVLIITLGVLYTIIGLI
jgi:hypothetical protein